MAIAAVLAGPAWGQDDDAVRLQGEIDRLDALLSIAKDELAKERLRIEAYNQEVAALRSKNTSLGTDLNSALARAATEVQKRMEAEATRRQCSAGDTETLRQHFVGIMECFSAYTPNQGERVRCYDSRMATFFADRDPLFRD